MRKSPRKSLEKSRRGANTAAVGSASVSASEPWPFRPYQQAAVDAFDKGKRRQILIWHRRAGKDVFGMSLARRESSRVVGGYVHFFPKHIQAKRAIWNGVDPGLRKNFIQAAFGDRIIKANNTEMFLELDGGSTWQLLGSDNYDRVVGSNMVGAVFSEWALCDPLALDYIRPIIVANHGWILLITTYRGRNHAWQMAQSLKDSPDWFVDVRTIEATTDIHGKRIITDEDIAKERADGVSEAIIKQEYFCDPSAAVPGAVYAVATEAMIADARRQSAQWQPLAPVIACWSFSQVPVCSGVVFIQPGESPRVIGAELFPFMTIPEAIAKSRAHRWKASEHVIRQSESGVLDSLGDLRIYPEVIADEFLSPGRIEPLTQAFIETASVNALECRDLIDSLTGYTRRALTEDESRPYFSAQYSATWHSQLSQALELGAVYGSASAGGWHRSQSYQNFDRRII